MSSTLSVSTSSSSGSSRAFPPFPATSAATSTPVDLSDELPQIVAVAQVAESLSLTDAAQARRPESARPALLACRDREQPLTRHGIIRIHAGSVERIGEEQGSPRRAAEIRRAPAADPEVVELAVREARPAVALDTTILNEGVRA